MRFFLLSKGQTVRHFDDLSIIANQPSSNDFSLEMSYNQVLAVQILAVADVDTTINTITYDDSSMKMSCINHNIVDKCGVISIKSIPLKAGIIQPLFFIVECKDSAKIGQNSVAIHLSTTNGDHSITLNITVASNPIANKGYDDLASLSRLNWLNSTAYSGDSVTYPYTAPLLKDNTINILGRTITLTSQGLPKTIVGNFDQSNQISTQSYSLLAQPMEFYCNQELQYDLKLQAHNSHISIASSAKNDRLSVDILGNLNYEGSIYYDIILKANENITLDSVGISTLITNYCSQYITGLGAYGGEYRDISFKWAQDKHLDCLYIGNVNLGMRVKWKAEEYIKPLINLYYKNSPLVCPSSTWSNQGSGGITLKKNGDTLN